MVKNIMYGRGDKGYYVQTCCNEEHLGQLCDCVSYGENLEEDKAKEIAKALGLKYQVSVLNM